MVFAGIEDLQGKLEVIIFPRLLEETQKLWFSGAKLVIEGKVSTKDDSIKILAEKVYSVTDFMEMAGKGEVGKECTSNRRKGKRNEEGERRNERWKSNSIITSEKFFFISIKPLTPKSLFHG